MNRRRLITGMLLAPVAMAARAAPANATFDAVVGAGGHPSVQSALNAAPAQPQRPFRILIRAGTWREKLIIDKPFIHLIGEHRQRSVIAFDAWSGQTAPDGQPWGTRRSATLTIAAGDCAASNLTVLNDFDYRSAISGPPPLNSARGFQAVALATLAPADRLLFDSIDIVGYQDTLLTDNARALFRTCCISGAVDFIFGAGTSYFEQCELHSRTRAASEGEREGYVTAPSTLITTAHGLVFDQCRLTRESGLRADSVALGRPWRPTVIFPDGRYGNPAALGQAVFLRCWMDDHIDRQGWDRMAYSNPQGERAYLEPETARFFEYRSRGPGAAVSPQRRQLSDQQAAEFGRDRVLAGWRAPRSV